MVDGLIRIRYTTEDSDQNFCRYSVENSKEFKGKRTTSGNEVGIRVFMGFAVP